ncbi:hypothetical protein FHS27_005411 [Rhodopirellula rubra]|uniref:Uncharacterized protein n=1 Tax=Aporhodopirellula rubra TaxID=980271 RepID=A0A7W5H900_9BACT|nr:hypothetical protein [Aporhodopirellula rubra]
MQGTTSELSTSPEAGDTKATTARDAGGLWGLRQLVAADHGRSNTAHSRRYFSKPLNTLTFVTDELTATHRPRVRIVSRLIVCRENGGDAASPSKFLLHTVFDL